MWGTFIIFHRVLLDLASRAALEKRGVALLAFDAFEKSGPVFRPTPSTPDPQTIRGALNARDANEWRAAVVIEIENMRHLCIFTAFPRLLITNIIMPRWIIHL